MKLLHLTDIHFESKRNLLLDELKNKLLEILEHEKIDYFVFSGDLVSIPSKVDDFNKAKEYILDPILKKLSLKESSLIICQGNHDIQKNQELPLIRESFLKFKKTSEIDEFIKIQNGEQLEASLKNHQLYFDFLKSIPFPKDDVLNPLYTIHKRTHANQNINIVTLNSAWRCYSSATDPGNLFYPLSVLNGIIKETDKNALKILVMHHPLREFKEFVAREMEDLIFDNFHIMFTGHLHKSSNSVHFANDIGIFCSASQATFNRNTDGIELGFSIIDFDSSYLEFSLVNYFFHEKDKRFYEKSPITSRIPQSLEKEEQNKLRKSFRKRFEEGKVKADELLLSNDDKFTFLELFADPVICDKPKSQLRESSEHYRLQTISTDDKNYLIFGKDKYGKTSLLYKMYLDLLDTFTDRKIIVYYLDFKIYKFSSENFDLMRNITVFCETSANKMTGICKNYKIKLLIDNYTSDNDHLNRQLLKLIESCSNVSIIATIEETLISGYQNYSLNSHKFENLFIHDIGRSQVRTLTNKWPEIDEERREDSIEKITKTFNQLNIPYNYWTVSLFLWVFNKTKESNFHNNFDLIQLYIDGLLERKKHVIDKSIKISFEDLKEYLAFLAYILVKEYHKTSHAVEFHELVEITNNYRKSNKKIVIETSELIDLITHRGIIKKTDDNRFTFRLNGVFEYFIAFYMKDNRKFTFDLINDDSFYLSFYNEFELYSGFNRKDTEFVKAIFEKTQRLFDGTNKKYFKEGDVDTNLNSRIVDIDQITKELSAKTKDKMMLSHQEQDDFFSDITPVNKSTGGVTQKKFIPKIEETSDHLEKALFILCRVFRNSNINEPDLDKKILDYILDTVCSLGFLLIDETKRDISTDEKISAHEKTLIKLIMDLMPMVIQTFLFEALAQNNLERLLEENLEELKKTAKDNQFKLFIVYYLLIDLDFKNKKHLIKDLTEQIKMGVLKHSNLVKLYIYLAFKAHGKKALESELQAFIRAQEKSIDSRKSVVENIDKKIETTKKIGRIKRDR